VTRRRLLLALCLLVVLLVAAAAILWSRAHGSRIPAEYAPNHGVDFDLGRPPCEPAPRPADRPGDMLVRYLGTSGVYIERDGVALMTAPFFSNPGLLRTGLGKLTWNDEAIRAGLAGLDLDRVEAVLIGHAHYDHVGDLPRVLPRLSPRARVLANRTVGNLLAPCEAGARRWVDAEAQLGEWIPLGARLRALPLESTHAPHIGSWHLLDTGDLERPWDDCDWERRRPASMPSGRTLAWLIDLLEPDGSIGFRIHYQDSASSFPAGSPPAATIADHPVDLAIVCMPSSWLVSGYPQEMLAATRARHVLVTHYEDFFRPQRQPLRFAPLLTDRRAAAFMARVAGEMSRAPREALAPADPVCGPAAALWSLPLPGEWLRFADENRTDGGDA
jgi:hypothetical protein